MSGRKSLIAARFGAAAGEYDEHSSLQREAASRLASRVLQLGLPPQPRVLEIGCGTGHLTRALQPVLGGVWLATDIAPQMVAACRASFGDGIEYAVMDGEHPALADRRFDLIVASLATQWFADLPTAFVRLAQLLAPGGRIALVTVGDGTFAEWQEAHAAVGLKAATPDYPDAATLAKAFPAELSVAIQEEDFVEPLEEPIEFVRGLRRIGADTPAPGTKPLTAGQMRKVMKALLDAGHTGITYRLLYAIALRSSSTSQPRTTR
jgi:malonyl-CoA O-methyltransferase